MSSANPRLAAKALDSNVLGIGLLTGILRDRDEGGASLTDEVELNVGWFSRPIEELEKIPSERTDQLYALIEEIVGAVTPGTSGGGGLRLARRTDTGDVLGLEYRPPAAGRVVQPSLYLPLFDLAHQKLVVGRSGYPLELRVAVSASDKPLIQTSAFRIGSLSLSETIAFDKAPDLPDIVLSDVAWHPFGKDDHRTEITLRDLVDQASGDAARSIAFLVDLLAAELSGPGSDNATVVTALRNAVRLLSVGNFGTFRGVPFFAEVAGNDQLLKEWLAALQSLLHGTDAAADSATIQGSGTEADPFLLRLAGIGVTGSVSMTFARQDTGRLLAGVALESDVYELGRAIGVQMRAVVDIASFEISGDTLTPTPAACGADLGFTLCHAHTSRAWPRPLFEYAPLHWIDGAPDSRFSIGAVRCGIRVRPQETEPARRLQASLALERVERLDGAGAGVYDYDLLTLTRQSAGGATEDARDAVSKLLADLARALPAAYDASQPAADLPMPDLIGAVSDRSAYRSLIDALRSVTGAREDGIGGVAQSIAGLAAWIEAGDLENRSFEWLKARIQDGAIFGAAGGLLARFSPTFAGEDTRLVFKPTDALSVSVGKSGDSGFGLRVEPRLEAGAVRLSLSAGVALDVSGKSSPSLQFTGSAGLTEQAIRPLLNAGVAFRPDLDLALTLSASPSASLTFYPIGDRAFAASLLPKPGLAYESRALDVGSWLLRLAPRVLLPLVEMRVLNRADVKDALEHPVFLDFSLAKFLTHLELLQESGGVYHLGDWSAFAGLSAAKFLGAIVDSLQADEHEAQADGVHFVAVKNAAGTATDYGLRIRLIDVPLGGKDSGRTLQAGRWLSEETDGNNWLTASGGPLDKQPGVELFLCRKTNGSFSFDAARIELTSVGLDFEGKALASGRKPLVDVNGYAVQKLKSRLYLSVGAAGAQFGGAIELNDLSMPLGPKVGGESGSGNPVAANLLASGPSDASGQQEPVNPAFSAIVAYRDRFYGKVFVANGTPSADGKVWLPIGRSFGPLRCRQIGLGFNEEHAKLDVGYDGSVSLAALAIDLDRLSIGIPLREPANFNHYDLGLGGLHVSLSTSAVQITGGLSRIDEGGKPRYDGMALIKAQDLTITGFGSYAMAGDAPSLFVFAVLHKDLGGPAFFHVTGVAAGFGFNRALRLPPVEEVQAFPLVRAALDEQYLQSGPDALSTAMTKLRDYIPPSRGDCWLAIGVRFSSFEMIQSFALLSVSFGHDVEIGLLGMATMSVPKGARPGEAVAYAELALRAVIKPAEGLIAVEGRLTDKSYIFSRDCRLTGGFAFFTWFSGPHAGDFVVTIGGYHPRFVPPSHYPTVPRLGINWRVNGDLSITGELYYALTPSCLMAGGRLAAVYHSGAIDAWFTAYANFLLNWQPFYYQIEMGISIGVSCSVRINLLFCSFTLSLRVEIGVTLRLWGPPFAGEIYVSLSVISFTIRFGGGRTAPKPLVAAEFIRSCLPPAAGNSGLPDVLSVRIADGLIREQHIDDRGVKRIIRMVNAHELALTAQSIVPSTSFGGVAKDRTTDTARFGIRPMGQTSLASTLTVSLFKKIDKGGTVTREEVTATRHSGDARLRTSLMTSGVPEALWGKSAAPGQVSLPGAPEAKTIPAAVGVRISCAPPIPEHDLPPVPLEKLKYDDLPSKPVYWMRVLEPGAIDAHGSRTIGNTIWGNPEVDAKRQAVLGVLARVSPFELYQPHLERLSASSDYFQAEPEFALVALYGTPHGSALV